MARDIIGFNLTDIPGKIYDIYFKWHDLYMINDKTSILFYIDVP